MRVYFVGAHSTGKTTIARYVSKKYGLPLVTEAARVLMAEKELSISAMRTDIEVQNDFQQKIMRKQIAEEKKHESFVSDRGFDNLAYACEYTSVFYDILQNVNITEYIKRLHEPDVLTFFIRPNKQLLSNDGVREDATWENVVRIDSHVKFMLEMWRIRYFPINTPNLQERIRFVDSVIPFVKPVAPLQMFPVITA